MRENADYRDGRPWRIGTHRGRFVVRWTGADGRQFRISTGTDDRGLAETRAGDIWAAHNKPVSERLEHLWPIYAASRALDVTNPEKFHFTWLQLQPHFGHRIARNITREDCRAYYHARAQQGRADSTVATELQMLRACLNFTFGKNAPAIWLPPSSKPRDTWLTKPQVQALLDAAKSPHIQLYITLAVTTAARMSAILDLQWQRVDLVTGTIDYMPGGRHKNNKGRPIVPINARAKAALEQAYAARLSDHVVEYNGAPVSTVQKTFQRMSTRTGIKCSPHIFRHTAGVWMAQADIPMEKISQYMGHSTVRVTERHYARYSPSFMQDAAAALNW